MFTRIMPMNFLFRHQLELMALNRVPLSIATFSCESHNSLVAWHTVVMNLHVKCNLPLSLINNKYLTTLLAEFDPNAPTL